MNPSYNKVFKIFEKEKLNVPLEVFHNNPYKALISTVMSARTKDETTLEAANRLFRKAPDFENLSKLDAEVIEKLIYPVGFYKTKAKNIIKLAEAVLSKFDGKVPKNIEDLITLPGVGRKTANLVLNRAYDVPAISVDTHVHRISNLIGWVDTKNRDTTEKELAKIVPKKYWGEINRRFVSVGRTYGTGRKLLEYLRKNELTD